MPDTYSSQVAAEVRATLARQGKTASDLRRIIGVSRPTAAARWSGAQPYQLDELQAIADAIGVDVASLLTVPATAA